MTFTPQWASAPGDTLVDILQNRGWTAKDLARELDLSIEETNELLIGSRAVDVDIAERLSRTVGSSSTFWMVRDVQYREDLRWLDAGHWAESLPLAQMKSMGWVKPADDQRGQVSALLEFFAVSDVDEWRARYGPIIAEARLRVSATLETNVGALAAWLRRGEQLAMDTEVGPWNPRNLQEALSELRPLTKVASPRDFVPRMRSVLSQAGIAVVLLKSPTGSPVSGAARVLADGRALIQLSGRFLSDDQLWFTVYHEAGHLALHGHEGLFLDDEAELSDVVSEHEREANEFAQLSLLGRAELSGISRPTAKEVIRAASELGIAPGIVVGHLQHSGVIGYNQLNGLKRRYVWSGPNLESRSKT